MNNIAICIAVVAACFATTYALSVESRTVNWPAVAAKVNEIRAVVVENTFDHVKTIANNANGQVGGRIGAKTDAAAATVNALLGQLNAAIDSQYLTIGQAREVVGEIKGTIGRLTGSIQADLNALSRGTATQIRQTLSASFDAVEVKTQGLVTLLRA